jgi:hypothetical protein
MSYSINIEHGLYMLRISEREKVFFRCYRTRTQAVNVLERYLRREK